MKNELKDWEALWTDGIHGMTEKQCQDTLCFFHGYMKSAMSYREDITMSKVVEGMRLAIKNAKQQTPH